MSRRIAYLDCFSGVSGDMLLGALLDVGLDLAVLTEDLAALGVSGYELAAEKQVRRGIAGTKFDVVVQQESHPARHLGRIRDLLTNSTLPDVVVDPALRTFTRLAEAEAAIHGTTTEEVHFHEVGAVDALVDIVGFCCGLYRLGIEAVYSSALALGGGTVQTAHGLLPVPAPATLALLASANAPVKPSGAFGEMVTPTGAALLATLAEFRQPAMVLQGVGYGFGTKEFPWANAVRVWIGTELDDEPATHLHPHSHSHEHEHEDEHHGHEHEHH